MKYFILFILCLIHITACKQENIEVPDTGRKIVINGLITTDQLFNVSLTQSGILTDVDRKYQNTDLHFNAKIYQNNFLVDSLYGFPFDPDARDSYIFPGDYGSKKVIPLPGNEYKIVANVAGFPDASAITKIPNLIKINFIDSSRVSIPLSIENPYGIDFVCNVQFSDPPDEKNYYMLLVKRRVYSNSLGYAGLDPYHIYIESTDPIIEEKLDRYGIVFSDKIINGKKHTIPIKIGPGYFGYPFYDDRTRTYSNGTMTYGPIAIKTFYFRLYSITEDFYKYIQTLNLYNKNFGNPLTDPVLMYSNVSGGFGIFTGAALSVDSLVYDYSK